MSSSSFSMSATSASVTTTSSLVLTWGASVPDGASVVGGTVVPGATVVCTVVAGAAVAAGAGGLVLPLVPEDPQAARPTMAIAVTAANTRRCIRRQHHGCGTTRATSSAAPGAC